MWLALFVVPCMPYQPVQHFHQCNDAAGQLSQSVLTISISLVFVHAMFNGDHKPWPLKIHSFVVNDEPSMILWWSVWGWKLNSGLSYYWISLHQGFLALKHDSLWNLPICFSFYFWQWRHIKFWLLYSAEAIPLSSQHASWIASFQLLWPCIFSVSMGKQVVVLFCLQSHVEGMGWPLCFRLEEE